jgi:hypothetical protein
MLVRAKIHLTGDGIATALRGLFLQRPPFLLLGETLHKCGERSHSWCSQLTSSSVMHGGSKQLGPFPSVPQGLGHPSPVVAKTPPPQGLWDY